MDTPIPEAPWVSAVEAELVVAAVVGETVFAVEEVFAVEALHWRTCLVVLRDQ